MVIMVIMVVMVKVIEAKMQLIMEVINWIIIMVYLNLQIMMLNVVADNYNYPGVELVVFVVIILIHYLNLDMESMVIKMKVINIIGNYNSNKYYCYCIMVSHLHNLIISI